MPIDFDSLMADVPPSIPGECQHYDERPSECHRWERGDQGCRDMRKHLIELGHDRDMPDDRIAPRPRP